MIVLYGSVEWDARMIGLWTAIGWHMRAATANLNTEDLINIVALLTCRISRLEILECNKPLFGLF